MADDASIASFRSLSANAGRSLNDVSRSSLMLRRQQQQRGSSPSSGRRVVGRGTAPGQSSSRPSTSSSSRRNYLNIMDDVRAWEEAKARERVEARLREEEAKREEDAREREARARAAEEEASERAVELERRVAEQRELRQRLAKEQEARIEAAAQLAEMQRLENERLRRELAERERLEEERLEAERLAVVKERRRRLEEEEARKAKFSPPFVRVDGSRQPSRGEKKEQGGVLAEDATVVSELTDFRSPDSPAGAETAAFKVDDGRGHKIKRSASTRSLQFTGKGNGPKNHGDYSPATGEPQPPPRPFAIASIEDVDFGDPAATRALLMGPCPRRDGVVQLVIRRNKGLKNALSPEYRVYLRSGSGETETFLMTSKKRTFASKTSSYLISMSRNDHDKRSENVLGKLRSNFLGTEYVIYDGGKNPEFDDAYYDESNGSGEVRRELGAVLYAPSTALGAKSPRKMTVCISRVDDESGEPLRVWQPRTNGSDEDRLIPAVKEAREEDKIFCFRNKPPTWSDEAGAYVLNFNGRVTMASVKNFQLLNGEEQVLQFGRVGKDEFSVDVKWPLSLFQAFAVCLSSFDSKLGCD